MSDTKIVFCCKNSTKQQLLLSGVAGGATNPSLLLLSYVNLILFIECKDKFAITGILPCLLTYFRKYTDKISYFTKFFWERYIYLEVYRFYLILSVSHYLILNLLYLISQEGFANRKQMFTYSQTVWLTYRSWNLKFLENMTKQKCYVINNSKWFKA